MKAAICQLAVELGFDDCRVTTAAAPATAGEFQRWLAEKKHAGMEWLERNASKRADPQMVLPGARSLILLAASYQMPISATPSHAHPLHEPWGNPNTEDRNPKFEAKRMGSPLRGGEGAAPVSAAAGFTGVVARYARFADYHDVLAEPLKQLVAFVNQLGGPDTRSLWYVDTGPLLERDLAQRAGLGFVGKHTNLISRRLGNWIFLAEILTTLELEPDAPGKNRCGSCTRCLTACPTQAIPAPFQLDARRCISYLTIELKGAIPVELRPAIGNRIYGCDDCLAACPWNKFAQAGRLMQPHARPDLRQPDLLELLRLDAAGFKARFAGTPVLRTKRRGFLRNVCVALGNIGDASALPDLEKAVADPEPLIAGHARWAMEQIQARKQG